MKVKRNYFMLLVLGVIVLNFPLNKARAHCIVCTVEDGGKCMSGWTGRTIYYKYEYFRTQEKCKYGGQELSDCDELKLLIRL